MLFTIIKRVAVIKVCNKTMHSPCFRLKNYLLSFPIQLALRQPRICPFTTLSALTSELVLKLDKL